MFTEALHDSFQPKRFESVHPHALKSVLEDAGMPACGLHPPPTQ